MACDCHTIRDLQKSQKSEFEVNSLIFIGQVVELNSDNTYKMRIIELLKGTVQDSTIVGEPGYCSIGPLKTGETWLVYTGTQGNKPIVIHECGLSRSYSFPYYFGSKFIPGPPRQDKSDNLGLVRLDEKIEHLESHILALKELREEIEQLRSWR